MLGLDVVEGVHVMAYRIRESKSKVKQIYILLIL